MIPSNNERRWLLVIVLAAFGLRLGWLIYAHPRPPLDWIRAGDQFSYWYYGNELARGRGYVSYVTHQPTAYYPIGYPALLGALFFVVIHSPLPDDLMFWAGLLHVALGTATVVLVYVIGRRLFGPRTALTAAALLAIFPNAIYEVASTQLETAFIFFSTAALAVIVTHDWSSGLPSRNRLLAFGAVLGLSVLIRPFSVWFLVGLFLAAVAADAGWRRAVFVTLIPAVVIVAMEVPWIVRNEVRMHALVLTSTNTGDTLCLDRNMTAQGGFRFADHDGCVDPQLPEVPRSAGNTRKAVSFVLHHPTREALQIVRRAKIEFAHDDDGIDAVETLGRGAFLGSRVRHILSSVADWYFYAVALLALAGFVVFVRRHRRKPEARIVLVAAVSLLVVPLLLWGNPRFHLPLYPYVVLFAAAAVGARRDRRVTTRA